MITQPGTTRTLSYLHNPTATYISLHNATKAKAAAAPPTTHCAFPVIFGTPPVLELLDPVAAVCEGAPVLVAVLFPVALFSADVLVIVVEAGVLAAAANPAVIVTICPPSSDPPFENEVVSTEDVAEEETLPRAVPLQTPLIELVITHPRSMVSLSPSPSSRIWYW